MGPTKTCQVYFCSSRHSPRSHLVVTIFSLVNSRILFFPSVEFAVVGAPLLAQLGNHRVHHSINIGGRKPTSLPEEPPRNSPPPPPNKDPKGLDRLLAQPPTNSQHRRNWPSLVSTFGIGGGGTVPESTTCSPLSYQLQLYIVLRTAYSITKCSG